jgi:hypothetical protein
MGSFVSAVLGSTPLHAAGQARTEQRRNGTSADSGRVSLSDIESSLRSLGGTAAATVGRAAPPAAAIGAVAGVALLAAAYLYGRRRGRRRATVLEIRRV